eukprot:c35407_g1_i1 orf=32-223(+)
MLIMAPPYVKPFIEAVTCGVLKSQDGYLVLAKVLRDHAECRTILVKSNVYVAPRIREEKLSSL